MSLKLFSVLLILCAGGWFAYEQACDNFHTRYCFLNQWPQVPVASQKIPEEIEAIFDKPFTYLGKGRQFFVFQSADGAYVLKLIKCQRFNLFSWMQYLQPERASLKQQRLQQLLGSCQLAAQELSDLTAVLFVHLQPSQTVQKKVALVDRLGLIHELDLDKVPFIIQRRAEQATPILRADPKRIEQLVFLFSERARRGVIDIDRGGFARGNIGFLEERAIFIDVGTFQLVDAAAAAAQSAEDISMLKMAL